MLLLQKIDDFPSTVGYPADKPHSVTENAQVEVDTKGNGQQNYSIHELDPAALRALHELVSLVHDRINVDKSPPKLSISGNDVSTEDEQKNDLFVNLEEDPVAKILWVLNPCSLHSMITSMVVCNFYSFELL